MSEKENPIIQVIRESTPLFAEGENSVAFLKKALFLSEQDSRQGLVTGEQQTPIDFDAAVRLLAANAHHGTCIITKRDATVGLGFQTEYDKQKRKIAQTPPPPPKPAPAPTALNPKPVAPPPDPTPVPTADENDPSKAEEILTPLCDTTMQDLMNVVGEDYEVTGNGYIEVVRAAPNQKAPIVALWHLPASSLRIIVEDSVVHRHFRHYPLSGTGAERRFARFGDLDSFLLRDAGKSQKPTKVSEVIHFKKSTCRSPYYGMPHWIPCVPAIELKQMIHQQQFDFFKNRGVPEFIMTFLGNQIPKETWTKIEDSIRATIGGGNQHKSIALNINDPNMQVAVHKLAIEGKTENSFQELNDVCAMEVVTAHRVPPLLAGIQIPGKLGAVNELPNAILAFQTLTVEQDQKVFTDTLGATLGNKELNGGLALERQDFLLRKITDRFNLQSMDTMSRMREPAAAAGGRDLNAGVKKEEQTMEEIGRTLGRLWLSMNEAAVA